VRIAVVGPLSARLERAVSGLQARGHAVSGDLGKDVVDVVIGERPVATAWRAVQGHARAVVLGLGTAAHARWSLLERWAWAVMGGFGLIEEHEVSGFLARVAEDEQERLALWPAANEGEAITSADTDVLERLCERALARRMAGPGRSALFVDRDGTLIVERHHLGDPEQVELLPGVAEALRMVRAAGHPVVVISNQAGVGRGKFTLARAHEVMARMRQLLRREGVELDAIRFCPHAPDAGCDCRKPEPRLLREVAEDLRLSLVASAMVGDKWIDVEAGHAVRGAGVLVRTGHGAEELATLRPEGARQADLVCDDLPAAARWFLAEQEGM
jgi:D-glycero-D-manno-heptose 1,7-bisphosphate phosphatase